MIKADKQRDRDCFAKAIGRDQLTFTLVEQDLSSPEVICDWITRNILTAPAEKLEHALAVAVAMRDSLIVKKTAD